MIFDHLRAHSNSEDWLTIIFLLSSSFMRFLLPALLGAKKWRKKNCIFLAGQDDTHQKTCVTKRHESFDTNERWGREKNTLSWKTEKNCHLMEINLMCLRFCQFSSHNNIGPTIFSALLFVSLRNRITIWIWWNLVFPDFWTGFSRIDLF